MSASSSSRARAVFVAAAVGVGLGLAVAAAACHPPPELPPVPPRPTDPTMAYQPLEVIDASIVSEGGESVDAAINKLDGAAASPRIQ